jgi:hypothetical protein
LFRLDTKCIGLLLLTLTRKRTSIGSLSTTPHGTCGVAILSRENGDSLRLPTMPTVLCVIVVSTHHSFRLFFLPKIPDRPHTSHCGTNKTDLPHSRRFCVIYPLHHVRCIILLEYMMVRLRPVFTCPMKGPWKSLRVPRRDLQGPIMRCLE